ncbi:hypothetical protein V8C86DRAFT_2721238 [Haematococcus lacustris]
MSLWDYDEVDAAPCPLSQELSLECIQSDGSESEPSEPSEPTVKRRRGAVAKPNKAAKKALQKDAKLIARGCKGKAPARQMCLLESDSDSSSEDLDQPLSKSALLSGAVTSSRPPPASTSAKISQTSTTTSVGLPAATEPEAIAVNLLSDDARALYQRSQLMARQLKELRELGCSLDQDQDDRETPAPAAAASRLSTIRNHRQISRAAALAEEQARKAAAEAQAEKGSQQDASPSQGDGGREVAAEGEEGKIVVTCQYAGGSIRISIRDTDTFARLLSSFLAAASKQGVAVPSSSAACRVLFDGDKMEPQATLASQDIEDGVSVDITWRS